MKQCPQCNRLYSDETLKFCLDDGERLIKPVWTRDQKIAFCVVLAAVTTGIIMFLQWRYPQPLPLEQCSLSNNNPMEKMVRVRFDCDRRSCDDDEKTIIGMFENGTLVQRKDTPPVKGKGFNWVQVVILAGGQTVWVAENKVTCKKP